MEVDVIYLGVDVAGASNTWIAGLSATDGVLRATLEPRLASLEGIVDYCREHHVQAVAIDAQLAICLSAENGFRAADMRLRELLGDCRNWVVSFNGLMAVPIRGRMLSEALAPLVGTILETHPRACLHLGLGEMVGTAVRCYKNKKEPAVAQERVSTLWQAWSGRFAIQCPVPPENDGALDALVCATVAYLYHHAPERLLKLEHTEADIRGRGPFYVAAEESTARAPRVIGADSITPP